MANVFTSELLRENVAIAGDRMAGLGRYPGRVVEVDIDAGRILPLWVD